MQCNLGSAHSKTRAHGLIRTQAWPHAHSHPPPPPHKHLLPDTLRMLPLRTRACSKPEVHTHEGAHKQTHSRAKAPATTHKHACARVCPVWPCHIHTHTDRDAMGRVCQQRLHHTCIRQLPGPKGAWHHVAATNNVASHKVHEVVLRGGVWDWVWSPVPIHCQDSWRGPWNCHTKYRDQVTSTTGARPPIPPPSPAGQSPNTIQSRCLHQTCVLTV